MTPKPNNSKKRKVNKALDRRFTLRQQRPPLPGADADAKSLNDIPDVPRRPSRGKGGLRRTQLGVSLKQNELGARDPARPLRK
jgi:hypothetical protein